MKGKILVIDDDRDICLILERFLKKNDFEVTTAFRGDSGVKELQTGTFDLIISDFRLPDCNGLELLKDLKKIDPSCKVIIITGYSDIKMAVEVIKVGAYDYVTKPLYPEELLNTINEAIASEEPQRVASQDEEDDQPKVKSKSQPKRIKSNGSFEYVLGKSTNSRKVFEDIKLVAPTDMSVIISGETGTGKEYVARAIHENSNRSDKPFIAVDCGALPKDIAGSELFGHEKGAFTGAIKTKDGKFKLADGGTLFLDEIGNLSYDIQVKLLRVLQERKITRIGGDKEFSVNVRILAATNDNLKKSSLEGEFREDLYHRLNEFAVNVTAIRNRPEDLDIFLEHFLNQANENLGKDVEGFDDEAIKVLKNYGWPGNLREVRNVVKRAVLLCRNSNITVKELPEEIIYYKQTDHQPVREPAMVGASASLESGNNLKDAAEAAERQAIVNALVQTRNNKSKAAKLLNIDRKTLYNKLKAFEIN